MRRRELIAGLVCASAVCPTTPRAQRSQVNRIGALVIGNADVFAGPFLRRIPGMEYGPPRPRRQAVNTTLKNDRRNAHRGRRLK